MFLLLLSIDLNVKSVGDSWAVSEKDKVASIFKYNTVYVLVFVYSFKIESFCGLMEELSPFSSPVP